MHDAGAAVAAAQVLAFFKEPVRYRPRLTHGHEPVQGGLHVLRFAQGRFPHALIRDLSVPERERLREAAVFFIRQVCLWDGATHYQLLGVAPDARRELIKDHYHGLMGLLHPDRQEASAGIWPATAAQRVNLAYGVLSDDEARHAYDSGLQKSLSDVPPMAEPPPMAAGAVRTSPARRRAESRARMRTPILAVSAVAASLLFAQMWWISDVPRDLAVLSSAAPLDVSIRWMREALGSKERPRFLTASAARGPSPAAEAHETSTSQFALPFLTPLWQALSAGTPEPQLRSGGKAAEPSAPAPAPVGKDAGGKIHAARANEATTLPAGAQADNERARPSPIAQASSTRAVEGPSAVGTADMEVLMARLVAFYEAGDVERLLGLYDAPLVGVGNGVRLRHDFQEFFRSTRARRLRLNRLAWEMSADGARAKGEVTVTGEYLGEPGRFERRVPIEVHAAMRDGQPRILRLSLFPHDG